MIPVDDIKISLLKFSVDVGILIIKRHWSTLSLYFLLFITIWVLFYSKQQTIYIEQRVPSSIERSVDQNVQHTENELATQLITHIATQIHQSTAERGLNLKHRKNVDSSQITVIPVSQIEVYAHPIDVN